MSYIFDSKPNRVALNRTRPNHQRDCSLLKSLLHGDMTTLEERYGREGLKLLKFHAANLGRIGANQGQSAEMRLNITDDRESERKSCAFSRRIETGPKRFEFSRAVTSLAVKGSQLPNFYIP